MRQSGLNWDDEESGSQWEVSLRALHDMQDNRLVHWRPEVGTVLCWSVASLCQTGSCRGVHMPASNESYSSYNAFVSIAGEASNIARQPVPHDIIETCVWFQSRANAISHYLDSTFVAMKVASTIACLEPIMVKPSTSDNWSTSQRQNGSEVVNTGCRSIGAHFRSSQRTSQYPL